MRKLLAIGFLAVIVAGCAPMVADAAALGPLMATATLAAPFLTPTPTIGYQATIAAAQATAAEAERLNVAVTAEAERRAHEQIQMTAQAEERNFALVELTATAAATFVPLTFTAQAVNWTAIADYQGNVSGALTATAGAPTQLVAMSRAENEVKQAPLDFIVRMFAFLALAFCLVGIGTFAFMNLKRKAQQDEPDEMPEIVPSDLTPMTEIIVRHGTDTAYPSSERMFIPCTPEQFTELAGGILSGARTFAFGQWNGRESPFKAQEFVKVRRALLVHRLVQSIPPDGRLMLTEEGSAMFRGWLDKQELTGTFEFGEGEKKPPPMPIMTV